jgi:hypothetical protein
VAPLEAIAPESGPRLNFADPEEANRLGELILEECPELSVEVNVEGRDGPNQVVSPDVGTVSPIELYEASVSEHRVRVSNGVPALPVERHPDGHREDPDDGSHPMHGRRYLDQRLIIFRPSKPAAAPFQPTLPVVPLALSDQSVDIKIGMHGNWEPFTVPRMITEEDLNKLASKHFGPRVATPDYRATPYQTQQFRFYPDVSHGPPIWITLRQSQARSKLTLIMRVSSGTTQEEIEQIASQVWTRPMAFPSKFPSVFDPN